MMLSILTFSTLLWALAKGQTLPPPATLPAMPITDGSMSLGGSPMNQNMIPPTGAMPDQYIGQSATGGVYAAPQTGTGMDPMNFQQPQFQAIPFQMPSTSGMMSVQQPSAPMDQTHTQMSSFPFMPQQQGSFPQATMSQTNPTQSQFGDPFNNMAQPSTQQQYTPQSNNLGGLPMQQQPFSMQNTLSSNPQQAFPSQQNMYPLNTQQGSSNLPSNNISPMLPGSTSGMALTPSNFPGSNMNYLTAQNQYPGLDMAGQQQGPAQQQQLSNMIGPLSQAISSLGGVPGQGSMSQQPLNSPMMPNMGMPSQYGGHMGSPYGNRMSGQYGQNPYGNMPHMGMSRGHHRGGHYGRPRPRQPQPNPMSMMLPFLMGGGGNIDMRQIMMMSMMSGGQMGGGMGGGMKQMLPMLMMSGGMENMNPMVMMSLMNQGGAGGGNSMLPLVMAMSGGEMNMGSMLPFMMMNKANQGSHHAQGGSWGGRGHHQQQYMMA